MSIAKTGFVIVIITILCSGCVQSHSSKGQDIATDLNEGGKSYIFFRDGDDLVRRECPSQFLPGQRPTRELCEANPHKVPFAAFDKIFQHGQGAMLTTYERRVNRWYVAIRAIDARMGRLITTDNSEEVQALLAEIEQSEAAIGDLISEVEELEAEISQLRQQLAENPDSDLRLDLIAHEEALLTKRGALVDARESFRTLRDRFVALRSAVTDAFTFEQLELQQTELETALAAAKQDFEKEMETLINFHRLRRLLQDPSFVYNISSSSAAFAGLKPHAQRLQSIFAGGYGFTSISAGGNHTCAVSIDGRGACWGVGGQGQLGYGGIAQYNSPVVTDSPPEGFVSISSGNRFSCGLTSNSKVRCWGSNSVGQLGADVGRQSTSPRAPGSLPGRILQVAAGGDHACALLEQGKVKCWGQGMFGQLGNGEQEVSRSPVTVRLRQEATQIAAGGGHSCAILASGAIRCWGLGGAGQLGNGGTANSSTPTAGIDLGEPAAEISAGGGHTCALTVSGKLYCWGSGARRQLGTGHNESMLTPTRIVLPNAAVAIAAGYAHTCAILESGQVLCWGRDNVGQTGTDADQHQPEPTAITIDLGEPAVEIAAGEYHTCVVLVSGKARCWGSNDGLLGTAGREDGFVGPGKLPLTPVPL